MDSTYITPFFRIKTLKSQNKNLYFTWVDMAFSSWFCFSFCFLLQNSASHHTHRLDYPSAVKYFSACFTVKSNLPSDYEREAQNEENPLSGCFAQMRFTHIWEQLQTSDSFRTSLRSLFQVVLWFYDWQ